MNQLPNFSYIHTAWEDRPKLWKYLVGILIVLAINLIGQLLSFGFFYFFAEDESSLLDAEGTLNLSEMGFSPAVSLILLIFPFAFIILGIWVSLRVLHNRTFRTLFSSTQHIDWGRFFTSFGIWIGLTAILEVISYLITPGDYSFNFEPALFIPFFIVTIIFLPIQTSAEEFLFRGYLTQGIGAGTRRGWIAILSTAIFFATLHIANPEIGKYGYILVVNYLSVGVLLGITTLMDERIELALGFHAANNIYSATIVTFSGSVLQTPALFTISELHVEIMVFGWFIPALIFLFIISRRYKWKDWNKLFERIPDPDSHRDKDEYMDIDEEYLSDSTSGT